ncbi:MAG: pyruvate ferredoxin oxidoreductase [Firmicutes bacterium]|nr:pyruvate ferredoxin oxidoreductase [Bacillota bacterium]
MNSLTKTAALVGTDAVAEAMRQINPDVVAAYPITPQTAIVETFSQMVADGLVKTHMIAVESEHSAMSATIGAASCGIRAMTCTSSQGLALMWELLYIASGLRLPIVMPNVNRSLSAPINIHCDHGDSMGARDSGWIQLFSENAQEAYDNTIQAIRIAEHPDVQLPVMVLMDGFIISHSIDRLDIQDDASVQNFIGTRNPTYSLLDAQSPVSVGTFDSLYGYFFEFKRQQEEGMSNALKVIQEVGKEFGSLFGRPYGLFETVGMEDAEYAVVATSSAAGTIRTEVERLRSKGIPIGMVKLRSFRPFPAVQLAKLLSGLKAVAVFDRSNTFAGNIGGPIFIELRSSLYELEKRPRIINYVFGLGGRDLSVELVKKAVSRLIDIKPNEIIQQNVYYLGLRE